MAAVSLVEGDRQFFAGSVGMSVTGRTARRPSAPSPCRRRTSRCWCPTHSPTRASPPTRSSWAHLRSGRTPGCPSPPTRAWHWVPSAHWRRPEPIWTRDRSSPCGIWGRSPPSCSTPVAPRLVSGRPWPRRSRRGPRWRPPAPACCTSSSTRRWASRWCPRRGGTSRSTRPSPRCSTDRSTSSWAGAAGSSRPPRTRGRTPPRPAGCWRWAKGCGAGRRATCARTARTSGRWSPAR
jgi:hypothetical protein